MTLNEVLHKLEESSIECLAIKHEFDGITAMPLHYLHLQQGLVLKIVELLMAPPIHTVESQLVRKKLKFYLMSFKQNELKAFHCPIRSMSDYDGLNNGVDDRMFGVHSISESELGILLSNVKRMIT